MKESGYERRFAKELKARGAWCAKWVSPGNAGVPDRIVIAPGGRIYFIELKTDTGTPSALQRYVQKKLTALGADARILYGWEQMEAFIDEILPALLPDRSH